MQSRTVFFVQSVLFLLTFSTKLSAQSGADTVYFDDNWAICEQPVADYYRVCTLNKIETVYYKGNVEDYYINGQLEMKGQYDSQGKKKGHFIFYSENGYKAREGDYDGNKMKGVWSFYDKNGRLKTQFNCTSNTDFTPLLIINNNGDTIFKNGSGKFAFNSATDLPGIFPTGKNYNVTGQVVNGKKDGVFTYSINGLKGGSSFQEHYQEGFFVKAMDVNPVFNQNDERNLPYAFLDLEPENLVHIDNFFANALEFGSQKDRAEKLLRFLLLKQVPEIVSEAVSYEDNTKEIFNVVGAVIRKTLVKSSVENITFDNPPTAVKSRLLSFNSSADSAAPPSMECLGEFDINTNGYITKTSFKGKFDAKSIKVINFYLDHLSGLVSFEENGVKKPSKLVIHFYTVVRNFEGEPGPHLVNYSYYGSIDNDQATNG